MKTPHAPHPGFALSPALYFQTVHTLDGLLPPPAGASPAARLGRNRAAIDAVVALLPADANELDLAAQCVAARAHAGRLLHMLNEYENDIVLVRQLTAQFASITRLSLAVQARLTQVQTLRRKRDTNPDTANEDARTREVVEQSMLKVLYIGGSKEAMHQAAEAAARSSAAQAAARPEAATPEAVRPEPARPEPARPEPARPEPARPEAPRPEATQVTMRTEVARTEATPPPAPRIAGNVSKKWLNSRNMAFETPLSAHFLTPRPNGSPETGLHRIMLQAMADARPAGRELAANRRA